MQIADLKQQLLNRSGKLFLFHGICEEVVGRIIREQNIEAVFLNNDYTPFSRLRDSRIAQICKKNDVHFHAYDDALLVPPQNTLKLDNSPYKVFTAFYNNAKVTKVDVPRKNYFKNYYTKKILGTIYFSIFD